MVGLPRRTVFSTIPNVMLTTRVFQGAPLE
jgi:hypothetical protein